MNLQKITGIAAILLLGGAIVSCNNTAKKDGNTTDSTIVDSTDSASENIMVTPIADSKDFPGAALKIASITSEKVGADSAKITVKYDVSNFKLTQMTDDAHAAHMANSHDGQHIHFILDNTPYVALYKPEHSTTVALNTEHYLLSFLSRSYHESLKKPDAYKLVKFKVDAAGKLTEEPTPTAPSLFYSRPKGEYKGADAKDLLLDFYLVNASLSPDGYKVLADVNGRQFTLDKWSPYEIKGLPFGNAKVKLTLIDKDGNAVTGDNVTVERDFKLTE